MKNLLKLSAIFALSFTASAFANEGGVDATNSATTAITKAAACEDTIDVKVNGLVCDFCARALEKVFSKREEVSGIKVDLDKGNVSIVMHSGKTLDDATITELITDSGYNVTSINKGC